MKGEDKILAAQTALLWDPPFFGGLMLQLKKVDATDDPRINTMATVGTAFSDTFEKIAEHFPDARACIYLTYLLVSDFGKEPPMPVRGASMAIPAGTKP